MYIVTTLYLNKMCTLVNGNVMYGIHGRLKPHDYLVCCKHITNRCWAGDKILIKHLQK